MNELWRIFIIYYYDTSQIKFVVMTIYEAKWQML